MSNDTSILNKASETSVDDEILKLMIKNLEEEHEILQRRNADMQKQLELLNIDPNEIFLNDIQQTEQELVKLQIRLRSKSEIESNFICHANEKRSFNKIITKLKEDTHKLKKCNQELANEIILLDRELQNGNKEISAIPNLTNDQIKAIRNRIKDYENNLCSFQKYPWMKDSRLNIKRLQNEMKIVQELKKESEMLITKLEKYNGLKPSITEASAELSNLKKECDKITALITKKK